ncbi:bicarbonate transport ATP-binding protein CmpC [Roseibium sp. TrichSKD4]|uniref:CmpA/NrtA family ABC transporter substrate-binding protein n=1 Tax=Roseibium sp. TrichSKD4 TaxID=744980 RepID=UPI0001E56FE9|nr:CmpA/NrtA family ABC transporter substrate-binding protein [Roseibium sp. TrichSKD4]EFO31167.1 bicarbonate transport ATP-binding protein CmpC [Roseibium sp. TrichSKD4]
MKKTPPVVIAGFIPLLDSAVLVAALEKGFAKDHGIDLQLVRETSWANIRDRVAVGHFDVAHMLAPLPIASTLQLTNLAVPMLTPMVLGLGGNAITVSSEVWWHMRDFGAEVDGDPVSTGLAFAKLIARHNSMNKKTLRLGVVHPFSGHAYELRYWLKAAGINPDEEVQISVLPPQLMPDALATGQLDGYCVGEPWNTASVQTGVGRIVTYKQAIWPNSPEKVLGTTKRWATQNSETLTALLQALSAAADWCGIPSNVGELAEILSSEPYLNCPPEICLPALTGQIQFDAETSRLILDFLSFSGGSHALPNPAHAVWFYEQMLRWEQADVSESSLFLAKSVFDPDYFRNALGFSEEPPVAVLPFADMAS